MIKIQRVELVNFRSLPYAVVEPNLDDGITAFAGLNGTGKTSVVAGILWALYGTTPDGVTVRGLRRQGTAPGDECRVTVTFAHDGQTVEMTRALKGRNDSTIAKVVVDGVEMTNISTRAATTWLVNRLGGLDQEGFLTAFVVRQKELDGLVKARPADRKKLIERLAGIERMALAVQRARDEENDYKKTVAALPGSEQEVADAEKVLTAAVDQVDGQRKALIQAQETARDTAGAAETATAAADALQARIDARMAIISQGSELKAAAGVLGTRVQQAEEALSAARLAASGGTADDVASATAADGRAREELAAVQDAATAHARQKATIESIEKQISDLTDAIRRLDGRRAAAADLAQKKAAQRDATVVASDRDVAELNATDERLKAELADARAEHKRLTAAIDALTNTTDPHCPTCAQALPDPATLLQSLQRALVAVTADGRRLHEAAAAASAAVKDALAAVSTRNELDAAVGSAENQAADLTQQIAEAQDKIDALARDRDSRAARLAAVARSCTPEAVAAANNRVRDAQRALLAAQQAATAAAQIPQLAATVDTLTKELAAANDRLVQLRDSLALHPAVPEAEAVRIRTEASTAAGAATAAAVAAERAAGELTAAELAVTQAEKQVATEKAKVAAKQDAWALLEERVATREALEAFRQDRLTRIAPEIAEIASDLVARMSSGKFTAVDLDANFTPVVTDDAGMQRPAAWLSGGEESIVALALRVGIGEVIAGHKGGLLVLDEVLTAQDSERRSSTMAAIRELQGRQVITINHIAEALDIADSGYYFYTGESGVTEVASLASVATDDVRLDRTFDE